MNKYGYVLPSFYKENQDEEDYNINKTIADIDEVIKYDIKLSSGNTYIFTDENGVKQAKTIADKPKPKIITYLIF